MKIKAKKVDSCEKQNVIIQVSVDDDDDINETGKDSFLFLYKSTKVILEPGTIFWVEYGKKKLLWPAVVSRSIKRRYFVEKCGEDKIKITFRFLSDCKFLTVVKERVYPFKGKVDLFRQDMKINRSKAAKQAFEVANFMLGLNAEDRMVLVEELSKVKLNQLINKYRKTTPNSEFQTKYNAETVMGQLLEHLVVIEDGPNFVGHIKSESVEIDD